MFALGINDGATDEISSRTVLLLGNRPDSGVTELLMKWEITSFFLSEDDEFGNMKVLTGLN